MTEFSSCLSSLVFGRTRGGAVFFFRSPDVGEQGAAALLLASHQRMGSCPILAEGAGFFSELLRLFETGNAYGSSGHHRLLAVKPLGDGAFSSRAGAELAAE
jgi:hypothetical protein